MVPAPTYPPSGGRVSYERICFLASDADEAQEALRSLRHRYGHVPAANADVIVALGGDGFMLTTLHATMDLAAPVYGMNRGTVGFLMNEYHPDDLPERLTAARRAVINPLRMVAFGQDGRRTGALAINEVSLQSRVTQLAPTNHRLSPTSASSPLDISRRWVFDASRGGSSRIVC